jgi:putative oxidoreductase
MKRGTDGLALVGRVLLGLIFVISGWGKLTGFAGATGYIASRGLPMPGLLAAVAVAIELGGGLALMLGFKARLAALALAVFVIVATPIFHNFWDAPAAEVMGQQIHFLKNLSILGGLLMVIAFGPGRLGFDKG